MAVTTDPNAPVVYRYPTWDQDIWINFRPRMTAALQERITHTTAVKFKTGTAPTPEYLALESIIETMMLASHGAAPSDPHAFWLSLTMQEAVHLERFLDRLYYEQYAASLTAPALHPETAPRPTTRLDALEL